MDVDTIIKWDFFINDLHRHTEQLHKEQSDAGQFRESFITYRGQGMSKTDFEKMKKMKDGLLSFNNVLSTSKVRKIALEFVDHAVENSDLIGILFVMAIDPSQSTTPFASIIGLGKYGNTEDEILFSMHTVFRIQNIKSLDQNPHIFEADLTLTSDNDKDLLQLTDHIRKHNSSAEDGWHRLGQILHEMGRSDKAEQIFKDLLKQTTDGKQRGDILY